MRAPPRILVSDDEAPLVRALSRLLRRLGAETIEDVEGDVVALAQRHQPDLILLDVNHKVDGLELLKALKRNAATAALHVVMMSGDDGAPERLRAQSAGAEDFLLKPFGSDVIAALLSKIQKQRGE